MTLPQNISEFVRRGMRREGMQTLDGVELQAPMSGAAKGVCLFEHRVEDWGEVAGRGVDDLQYLGGCGLLIQCFARLSDEPRVLHRDDGLRREIFDERDFFFGKRPHFLAGGDDLPEQDIILAERHIKNCPDAAEFDAAFARHWTVDLGEIDAVDDAFSVDDALARHVGWAVAEAQLLHHCVREAPHRDAAGLLAVPELQAATGGAAQRVRLFYDRLEYWDEVTGRAVDDPQYLGRGRLLLQSLPPFRREGPRLLFDH